MAKRVGARDTTVLPSKTRWSATRGVKMENFSNLWRRLSVARTG